MAREEKGPNGNSIPISFSEADDETNSEASAEGPTISSDSDADWEVTFDEDETEPENAVDSSGSAGSSSPAEGSLGEAAARAGGPELAELLATRAEMKRLEGEVKELRESVARRQADFENYRKRMDRER